MDAIDVIDTIFLILPSDSYSQDVPLELVTAKRPTPITGSATTAASTPNPDVVALWHHKRGELTHVAVGDDGEVWGVNDQHYVHRWDPSSSSSSSGWDKRRGKLKQISVGNREHIWGGQCTR
mmetsp:Transcript_9951/g.19110  ORF Transcript_9951/g.19110 Transcript_9951/m.19110 type:complete len:122 (-) Transcript_9951:442-807(-)